MCKNMKCLVIILFLNFCAPNSISNVNTVFQLFTPKSLIRFFEFNDQGWNITNNCIKDIYLYLDGLQKENLWAYKLLDASGYYSGGLMSNISLRPGNPQQCIKLNEILNFGMFQDKIERENILPFKVRVVTAKYNIIMYNVPLKDKKIVQSICMPVSCNFNDLMQVLSYNNDTRNRKIMNAELVDVRILQNNYKFYNNQHFIILISLIMVMLIYVGFSSVYRHLVSSREARKENFSLNSRTIIAIPDNKYTRSYQPKISLMNFLHINNLAPLPRLSMNKQIIFIRDRTNIISSNCSNAFALRDKQRALQEETAIKFKNILLKSSFQCQISNLRGNRDNQFDDINCLNGLHLFSVLSITAIHTFKILSFVSDNVNTLNESFFFYTINTNGSFAIDTYFFYSGISLYYLFRASTESLRIDSVTKVFRNLTIAVSLIAVKVVKLLLPYSVAILLLIITMKNSNKYSIIEVPSNDHITCLKYMWKNLLYIDIFNSMNIRCMLWTWFISLEVIFFVFGLLLLLLSQIYPKYTLIIFISFYLSSFFATALTSVQNDSFSNFSNDDENLAYFNGIYPQPWIRIESYLIGLAFGYFLHKYDFIECTKKYLLFIGWTLWLIIVLTLFIVPRVFNRTYPGVLSCFTTLSHSIWTLVLIWLIYISQINKHGILNRTLSSNIVYGLNKLSNCVLLLHPITMRILILNLNGILILSEEMVIIIYLGSLIVSYVLGFIAYMLFEAPVTVILKLFLNNVMTKMSNSI